MYLKEFVAKFYINLDEINNGNENKIIYNF